MTLSIIIPIYNTEKTLERCLRSIAKQSFTDFEVILVDDGSPDNSGKICDSWCLKDSRFKVIHQVNGGLCDARNAGIEVSTGKYITFVDSDDTISKDTLLPLMTTLIKHPEYDFIEYPVYKFYQSDKQCMMKLQDKVYHDMFNDYWLKSLAYTHTYAANKIYKIQIFHDLRYPKGMKFEDAFIMPKILKICKTIATSSSGLYYYYSNPEGITQTATGDTLFQLLSAHTETFLALKDKNCDHDALMNYYMHIVNIQCDVYEMTNRNIILPSVKPGFHLIAKPETTVSLKIKIILINFLGLKKLCRISKAIHRIRTNAIRMFANWLISALR